MPKTLVNSKKLFTSDEIGISKAIEVIENGGLAILPADTVYGFFTCATDKGCVERVYKAKSREARKPFVIYTNENKVSNVAEVNDIARKFIKEIWPEALSLVLKKKDIIQDWFTAGLDTVAVMTAYNRVISRVIEEVSIPILGTTVNVSGEPEMKKAKDVMKFIDEVDLIMSDDTIPIYNKPSTMINCVESPPKLIRLSSLTAKQIRGVCPEIEIDLSKCIK